MKKKKLLLSLIVLATLLIYYSYAKNNEGKKNVLVEKIVFRYIASNSDSETSEAVEYFSRIVREKTNGELLVEIHNENLPWFEIMSDIKMGSIDITKINLSLYKEQYEKLVKVFESTPTKHEVWEILNNEVGEKLRSEIAEQDKMIIPIGYMLVSAADYITDVYVVLISKLSWDNLSKREKEIVIFSMRETESFMKNNIH